MRATSPDHQHTATFGSADLRGGSPPVRAEGGQQALDRDDIAPSNPEHGDREGLRTRQRVSGCPPDAQHRACGLDISGHAELTNFDGSPYTLSHEPPFLPRAAPDAQRPRRRRPVTNGQLEFLDQPHHATAVGNSCLR